VLGRDADADAGVGAGTVRWVWAAEGYVSSAAGRAGAPVRAILISGQTHTHTHTHNTCRSPGPTINAPPTLDDWT
jgi:hypothetical protein